MRAVEYVDLGRYLRDVRESLGISVEMAARDLHIRPKYLHDLEAGRLDDMPGKAYLRGYIRNYASYLQLDSREVLEEYDKLFGRGSQKFFVPRSGLQNNMPSGKTLWLCFAGLAGLYAYWYYAVYERPALETVATINEETVPESKMGDAWEKCLADGNSFCFLDFRQKSAIPDTKSAFVPDVAKPQEPVKPQADKPVDPPADAPDDTDD